MGTINSVTCKNKNCRYHTELYLGPGMAKQNRSAGSRSARASVELQLSGCAVMLFRSLRQKEREDDHNSKAEE